MRVNHPGQVGAWVSPAYAARAAATRALAAGILAALPREPADVVAERRRILTAADAGEPDLTQPQLIRGIHRWDTRPDRARARRATHLDRQEAS